MFRAASFGGQFVLLVARHLYFLFFVIVVLLHLANKICSVCYTRTVINCYWHYCLATFFYYSFLFIFNRIYCSVAYVNC